MAAKTFNFRFPDAIKQEADAHAARQRPLPMNTTQYLLTAVIEKNERERKRLSKAIPA